MSDSQLREAIKATGGVCGGGTIEDVRIAEDGAVECYGTLPNTNEAGWYHYASSRDEAEREIEYAK